MTHNEAAAIIGRRARLAVESGRLEVLVTIDDTRERFGRTDYHVTPVAGFGDIWASEDRVHILPGDQP